MPVCNVGVGWSAWRAVSWLQSRTAQCKISCENCTSLFLLNSSTVEKETLVFMFLEESCNSEGLLGATCQLSLFGRNMILGNESYHYTPW